MYHSLESFQGSVAQASACGGSSLLGPNPHRLKPVPLVLPGHVGFAINSDRLSGLCEIRNKVHCNMSSKKSAPGIGFF